MSKKEIKLIAIIKMVFSLLLTVALAAGSGLLSYSKSYVRYHSDLSRYHLDRIDGLQGLVDTYVTDPSETVFRILEGAIVLLLLYYVISFFLADIVRRKINKDKAYRPFCFLLSVWLLLPFVLAVYRGIVYRTVPMYAPVLVILGINVIYSLYFLFASFAR